MDIAELLAEDGLSSLDVKDMAGDTPLHWAVMLGNLKTVEFLLSKSEDLLEAYNYNKNTPLMIACTNNHLSIIELLLRHNANINTENANGMTPLHAACLAGNIRAVDYLLDHEPPPEFMKKDRVRLLILC